MFYYHFHLLIFLYQQQYYIQVPAGVAETVPAEGETVQSSPAYNEKTTFTVESPIEYQKFEVSSDTVNDVDKEKVSLSTQIKLYFNKSVSYNTGNIVLKGGTSDITFTSTNFTAGNPFIITPSAPLEADTDYHLVIPANALRAEECGLQFAGISESFGTSDISFASDPGPDGEINIPKTKTEYAEPIHEVSIVSDRPLNLNTTGSIKVYDMNNNLLHTISPVDPAVTIKG